MIAELPITLPHIKLAALSNTTVINPDKPTLLLLHGFLDNANSFIDLLPTFSEWQCIAIDMAGHGHSEHRSRGAHYHLSDYAYDLHQVIISLKLQKVILVGHSLGAIVCSIYAATKAEQLCGFIAIESCGPLSASEETTSFQIRECFESRLKAQSAIKNPTSMARIIKSRCIISDLSEAQAKTILSRNIDEDEQGKLRWLTDKQLRTSSPMRMTEKQATNILKSIECPRILILGNQGFDKVKAAIKVREEVFREVPIFNFEGGHHVHMDSINDVSMCIKKHVRAFITL